MNLKLSLPSLATAVTILMVQMILGIFLVAVVDSFSLDDRSPFFSASPTKPIIAPRGRFPLRANTEDDDTKGPTSNGRALRSTVSYPPSSRSTAAFAMYESLRRKSTIALRILENDPTYKALESRDRAFARLILTTAERRHGQVDKVIKKLVHQTKTKKVRRMFRGWWMVFIPQREKT
jgi:hypothetical protein